MKKRKISIRPMALLFLLSMIFLDSSGIAVLTLLAAAGHECGHLIVARLLKVPIKQMKLDLLGARLEVADKILSYGEEWLLAAGGPIASFLLSLSAYPLWNLLPFSFAFSILSFLLGLFNLLPIRTFDGGRMLECFLNSHLDPTYTRRIMRGLSLAFLLLLWLFAVYVLLRIGDGLSMFFFSMSLISRFFEGNQES